MIWKHFLPPLWMGCTFFRELQSLFSVYKMYIVSVHFQLLQSCPTLCNPMNCSLPGSSVHGISPARILACVAISSSKGSFQPRNWVCLPCMAVDSLPFLWWWLSLRCVRFFATPCTIALPPRLLCPWDFPGKNTRVGCHFLLQGILSTQGLNPHLLNWQADSLPLTHQESPILSHAATAAAKSLQSCPTLCDPIDGSPPGSAVPGILQVRTLEWVAISFSNVWKWKVKVKSLSRVWLFTTPWTEAYQAPSSMGFSRQEYWTGLPWPSPILSHRSALFNTSLQVLDVLFSSIIANLTNEK